MNTIKNPKSRTTRPPWLAFTELMSNTLTSKYSFRAIRRNTTQRKNTQQQIHTNGEGNDKSRIFELLKQSAWELEEKSILVPMTPLATLRTTQLFHMSCPRISSGVGRRSGSIWRSSGLGASPSAVPMHKTEERTVRGIWQNYALRLRGSSRTQPFEGEARRPTWTKTLSVYWCTREVLNFLTNKPESNSWVEINKTIFTLIDIWK